MKDLKHGQLLIDVPAMAEAWGCSHGQVRRQLRDWRKEGRIMVEGNVATIVNFDAWIAAINSVDIYHPQQVGRPLGSGPVRIAPVGGVQ